ncbi:hypothetical protein BJV74DRAFT_76817 [Russula compacta]|nr:hypothetical protein BJV74DRAFT_76817 [Russula compacta]
MLVRLRRRGHEPNIGFSKSPLTNHFVTLITFCQIMGVALCRVQVGLRRTYQHWEGPGVLPSPHPTRLRGLASTSAAVVQAPPRIPGGVPLCVHLDHASHPSWMFSSRSSRPIRPLRFGASPPSADNLLGYHSTSWVALPPDHATDPIPVVFFFDGGCDASVPVLQSLLVQVMWGGWRVTHRR